MWAIGGQERTTNEKKKLQHQHLHFLQLLVWYQLILCKRLQSHNFMQGTVKKVGRYYNISSNGCAWEEEKWDHHYVQPHCEKYSQENCLDWGKHTIFDVFTKTQLKGCLLLMGSTTFLLLAQKSTTAAGESY